MPSSKQELIGRLIAAFREAGNLDGAFEEAAAARLGIGPGDLRCLNAIENAGGLTAGELSQEVGVTSGAVTGSIDRLEAAGFARRVADPADRRKVRIEVTRAFRDRAEKIWGPVAADWQRELAEHFTSAELETAIAFLELTSAIGRRHLEADGE